MTDFAHCPDCSGSGEKADAACGTCGGIGERAVSHASLHLAVSAKAWADEQVNAFFSTWCSISSTFHAYGVESWSVCGDTLTIVQDTSCRGCYDTTSHSFPLAWFLAAGPERERLMSTEVERRRAEAEARRLAAAHRELAQTRARLASLEDQLASTRS